MITLVFLRFEKMISGMYMGELARLVLVRLCKQGLVFEGNGSDELFTPGQFPTKFVSEIERLFCDANNCATLKGIFSMK